jgi:outer membrane protein TolC
MLFRFCGTLLGGVLWLYISISSHAAETLSLESFRKQVALKDPALRGAQMQSRAALSANLSKDELTDTKVFASYFLSEDMRPTLNPSFQGTRTDMRLMSLGLQKTMDWGPTFSLSHNIVQTEIRDASATAIPESDFYDVFPEFKATVPLWRNFLGSETRAELMRREAEADARVLQAEIQYIDQNSQVDMTYFTHFANVENYKNQQELLERALRIFEWVRRQHSRDLMDIADLHQAEAAVTLRKIEIENAANELKLSARRLNDLRGVNSDEVEEVLREQDLDLAQLKRIDAQTRVRRDLLLQKAQRQVQDMEFSLGYERIKPQLELAAKANWVGRDQEMSEAQSEFQTKDQPYYYVGLQFTMPIDAPKYLKVREGLADMKRGQELILQTTERDFETAWKNFVDTGQRLGTQIALLRELENTQKMKADAERLRFQRGRSTTFQVLSFEQDYISARSRRIAVELEARRFITQLAMYK